jgi:hypothetical protein
MRMQCESPLVEPLLSVDLVKGHGFQQCRHPLRLNRAHALAAKAAIFAIVHGTPKGVPFTSSIYPWGRSKLDGITRRGVEL